MRLIDADKVVTIQVYDDMTEEYGTKKVTIADAIDEWSDEGCPETIDAEPIRHGKWIVDAEDFRHQIGWVKCSQCDFPTSTAYIYCPKCGARMENDDNM